ncbi:MAG TPA: hypothetical protein VH817_07580 [Thermoleophilaceae bacterium]|jgi:hypothetical protein
MRALALLATTALVAGLVAAAVALGQAGGSQQTLEVTVKPNKAGTKKHPRNVVLNIVTKVVTLSGQPKPTIAKAVLDFPNGSLYNGGKFPHCSQTTLDSRGPSACPKGSKIGSGLVDAFAGTIEAKPTVTAFNGPGKNHVELFLATDVPVIIRQTIPGTLTRGSGPYALKLTLPIPDALQTVVGLPVNLVSFQTRIKKTGLIQAASCPKSHKWPFDITTFTTDGQQLHGSTTVTCKR